MPPIVISVYIWLLIIVFVVMMMMITMLLVYKVLICFRIFAFKWNAKA